MFPTDQAPPKDSLQPDNDRTQVRSLDDSCALETIGSIAPSVLKSRFVLQDQLGSGGMGTVYRAKDLRKVEAQDSQPYLAIKVLNGDFREHPDAFIALQREAAKSQSLSHRNIVKIFDFDKDVDVPFMTMELLQGNELSELLREYPEGLPDSLAWSVIRGFCSALKHAHAEGVIHADLKPGNLFVTHSGQVKIFDFGLARAVHSNFSQGVMRTRSDVEDMIFDAAALGALTPAFASRAMLEGRSPNAADDVFAAGLVIYQILTGKHPYNRIPADKVDPRSAPLERPRQLSSRQWRALSQALALDEEDRLQSVALLQAALFEKSLWPMRLLATGLALIAVTLWFFNLKKDDEIRVVQQQAQQAARVEVGVDRVLELIQTPRFDPVWERQVKDELGRLAVLEDSDRLLGNAMTQLASVYVQRSMESADLDEAVRIARRGEEFGSMSPAWESISQRFQSELDDLLDTPAPTLDWLDSTEKVLRRLLTVAPNAHASALALHDTNTSYIVLLRSEQDVLSEEATDRALEVLANREFDADAIDDALSSRLAAEETVVQETRRDQANLDIQNFGQSFAQSGCPVGGLDTLVDEHGALQRVAGSNRALLATRTDQLLADCVSELSLLDPDAAASLQLEAVEHFGALARTQAIRLDPCDRQYLIGSGAQRGRAGMCVDVGNNMPELVVIPRETGAFAISRYEVSRAQFNEFCTSTERPECDVTAAQLPVDDINAVDAKLYAKWLSEKTGFRYRLPTVAEWQLAAKPNGAELDANMNCKIDVGGVSRGGEAVGVGVGAPNPYGVVNAFGNVAEWVVDHQSLKSVGGNFDDPIAKCREGAVQDSSGEPSPGQGFRLVREIVLSGKRSSL